VVTKSSSRTDGAPPVAYISGPLQAAEDLAEARALYERLAEDCRRCGWEPYLPHQQTDPVNHVEASATSVFARDLSAVLKADLIIAYVGAPSSGVGAELGIAYERGIPVVGLCGREGVASRFIEGLLAQTGPASLIRYRDYDDCRRQLTDKLAALRERPKIPVDSESSPRTRMRRLPRTGGSPAPS
jgi:2'-deoxynucleoside 5'-phosphate N-hydrolase